MSRVTTLYGVSIVLSLCATVHVLAVFGPFEERLLELLECRAAAASYKFFRSFGNDFVVEEIGKKFGFSNGTAHQRWLHLAVIEVLLPCCSEKSSLKIFDMCLSFKVQLSFSIFCGKNPSQSSLHCGHLRFVFPAM